MTAAGWVIGIIWTLIVFALLAGGIAWLVSALASRHRAASGPSSAGGERTEKQDSAREILDRRLANGELTIEQYTQLRDVLAGEPSSPSDGESQGASGARRSSRSHAAGTAS